MFKSLVCTALSAFLFAASCIAEDDTNGSTPDLALIEGTFGSMGPSQPLLGDSSDWPPAERCRCHCVDPVAQLNIATEEVLFLEKEGISCEEQAVLLNFAAVDEEVPIASGPLSPAQQFLLGLERPNSPPPCSGYALEDMRDDSGQPIPVSEIGDPRDGVFVCEEFSRSRGYTGQLDDR